MKWFIAAFLLACGCVRRVCSWCPERSNGVGGTKGFRDFTEARHWFRHPNSLGGLALGVLPFTYFLFFSQPIDSLFELSGRAGSNGARGRNVQRLPNGLRWCSRTHDLHSCQCPSTIPKDVGNQLCLGIAVGSGNAGCLQGAIRDHNDGARDRRKLNWNARQIISDSIEILARYPLGLGVDGFRAKRMELFGRHQDTHNLYLQVATQLGVQGLLVFLLFLVVLWKGLSGVISRLASAPSHGLSNRSAGPQKSFRRDWFEAMFEKSGFLLAVARATQAYLLVRLVLGLFGHDLYEVYWWIVTGLVLSLLAILGPDANRGHRVGRRPFALAAGSVQQFLRLRSPRVSGFQEQFFRHAVYWPVVYLRGQWVPRI